MRKKSSAPVQIRDNDPRRDLSRRGIVGAIRKLLQAGVVLPDGLHILNQWR